jgi:uncharacterized damage-inducible protein DinB
MEPLRELFRHHAWATVALLDYCALLPERHLVTPAPRAYGPIGATMQHLVAADVRYLERLDGVAGRKPVRESLPLGLGDLRERFLVHAEGWEKVLDSLGSLDVLLKGRGREKDIPHATNLLVGQAIHHGNDHRTQVYSTLIERGLNPPEVDFWNYWETKPAE